MRDDPSLVTALVEGPDIEPTSPLTYVGMVRFYGYAGHGRIGELARVLLEAGAEKDDDPPETALRLAAAFGQPEVSDLLIAACARPQSLIEAAGALICRDGTFAALSEFERACGLRAAAVNERLDVIDELSGTGP